MYAFAEKKQIIEEFEVLFSLTLTSQIDEVLGKLQSKKTNNNQSSRFSSMREYFFSPVEQNNKREIADILRDEFDKMLGQSDNEHRQRLFKIIHSHANALRTQQQFLYGSSRNLNAPEKSRKSEIKQLGQQKTQDFFMYYYEHIDPTQEHLIHVFKASLLELNVDVKQHELEIQAAISEIQKSVEQMRVKFERDVAEREQNNDPFEEILIDRFGSWSLTSGSLDFHEGNGSPFGSMK